ncbi:MAG TPA: SGNH/GDSL hydrolase family protein [Candidatus Sulfotelmatobacter sp.]|jgi:lysophospholipase L1-like esterase|nr:SGNH/GDSL hydrolase family protein [Candidatus Sulfotelmatobacter sp.]
MKKLFRCLPVVLSSLILALAVLPAGAQDANPAKTNRWDKDIRAFEESDRTNPPPQNAVLFIGSSNIRFWKNVAQAFPAHKVINRGFGGSEMSDAAEFAGRIVIPYHPKIVVIYSGDNDLADHKTPERVAADFKSFADQIHAALPDTVIVSIGVKPSPSRAKLLPQVRAENALLEAYCKAKTNMVYIDDFTPMLSAEGTPRPELFIKDGLHLNEQGRAIWISLIGPVLDRYDPPQTKK